MHKGFFRRGQSSLEFLMTYGWAILIIIVAVVVAWQWGFFSLGSTVQPGSFGFWGVMPHDFIMSSDGSFQVAFINNVGGNVTVLYYNVTGGGVTRDCDSCTPVVISPGESMSRTIPDLARGSPGTRFEVFMMVVYNDTRTGDSLHFSSGKIWGNYEQ